MERDGGWMDVGRVWMMENILGKVSCIVITSCSIGVRMEAVAHL